MYYTLQRTYLCNSFDIIKHGWFLAYIWNFYLLQIEFVTHHFTSKQHLKYGNILHVAKNIFWQLLLYYKAKLVFCLHFESFLIKFIYPYQDTTRDINTFASNSIMYICSFTCHTFGET